jgi:transcriptional regulator with XRE-family HTH domain
MPQVPSRGPPVVSWGIPLDRERLQRLRQSRVMSRRDLAEAASVGFSTYNDLESGYRGCARPETIRKLAGVLGVKPQSLVDHESL